MPDQRPPRDLSVTFRTSSFCTDGGCVGVAVDGDDVRIADTKVVGPTLRVTRDEWRSLTRRVKMGELDSM